MFSRAAVIQCLADLILKDVLKQQNQISEVCHDELKFELLQRVCFHFVNLFFFYVFYLG